MRTFLGAVAASSLLAVAVAGTAQASFPGGNGRVVHPWFCYDEEGCWVGMLPTGGFSLPTAPYPNELQPDNLAWSADGRRLAFDGRATRLGAGRALYIVNADGTGLTQVGRGDRIRYNPAWSPDGRKLVFTQDNGTAGSGDVYTITTSGGSLTRLTTAPSWDGDPDWSADGTRIAYTCRTGGRKQICQMTPTGAGKTVTTSALSLGTDTSAPSWSPDSQRLAFSARRRVYTMTRTGGSLRDITPPDGYGTRAGVKPAWSPDGTRIALEQACLDGPCWGIRSVRTDGSDPQWLGGSEDGLYLDPGAWQPLR